MCLSYCHHSEAFDGEMLVATQQEIKDLYKTTWEIKQKVLIDMAAGTRLQIFLTGSDLLLLLKCSIVAHPDHANTVMRLVQIAAHSSISRSR